MKMLITGASGFVGGALWRSAESVGHQVTGLGRRFIPSDDYIACDLTKNVPVGSKPEVVIHAAARSSPWGSDREFEDQNVTATRNVVAFCESNGRPHLVHVSTSAVMYENKHQLDMDESYPLPTRAINRYAATKRRAELVVRNYSGPWCIIRPRAVFGPGDTVVFPRIIKAAKAGRLPMIASDEAVLADLIYIETLTDYILRVVERRSTGLYLLTNNQPVPILGFLESVLSRLSLPPLRRRVTVGQAMRTAFLVEGVYSLFPFLGEPPLTRFGVSVFAYSKTFNVAKSLRELGAPSISISEGVDRFITWQRGIGV